MEPTNRIESRSKDLKIESNRIESEAKLLASRLNDTNPEAVWFYYRVVKKLSKGAIDRLVGTSIENGRKPAAYFNHLASKEMAK